MHATRTVSLVLVAIALTSGCRASERASAENQQQTNWNGFEGNDTKALPEGVRVVPETPIEITGVPYIRAIQLSWTNSEVVPTYEPQNQTLKIPAGARQAVLLVTVIDLPESSRIRVEWYFGATRAFSDTLASTDDGDHYFSLVMRDGKRVDPLPAGEYRADVFDGQRLIKSVHFQVVVQGARS